MKTALVVDDSTYMRLMIKKVLIKRGYEIIGECNNGMNAIDMAIELQPDLITLDNILPDMMGIDILETIRAEVSSKILMISAVGNQAMLQKADDLGAEDYVVKPFNEDQLVSSIQRIELSTKRQPVAA
ncbi:MAG: response regulator [Cyclobacteriaceae bacterium]